MDDSWIQQRMHLEVTPQQGDSKEQPLCAILTGVVAAPMTHDAEQITCDACKAVDMSIQRRNSVTISSP